MTPLEYIRTRYGVPAKRGARVAATILRRRVTGTITSASTYLRVRPDPGQGYTRAYRLILHPLEVDYLDAPGRGTDERRNEKDAWPG